MLFTRQIFASYAEQFTAEGDTRAGSQGRSRKVVRKGFDVDEAMIEDFRQFVIARKIPVDAALFARDKAFIRAMIRYDIDQALFTAATARHRLIADDPQAQFALTLFPEAEKLTELAQNRTSKVGQ
jgi:hypothetical protein